MARRGMTCVALAAGLGLALTGFSSHGSHGKSRGSGGSCSNSHKSNGSSDSGTGTGTSGGSGYDGSTTTGSTSGTTGGSASGRDRPATATTYVTACASAARGESGSTIKVSTGSGSPGSHGYQVRVTFYDKAGAVIDRGSASVSLGPNATSTVKVAMSKPTLLAQVDLCGSEATAG